MSYFHYQQGELLAEQVALSQIANEFGTPCYVYSRAAIENNWHAFNNAFGNTPHLICYAVKANSSIAILNILARLHSGFDIVSIGELERVLAAGGDPKKIVFSGVGKTATEMMRALEIGIHCFNIESEMELECLHSIAKQTGKIATISLRVNPNIDARTHPYIATGLKENKFGIDIEEVIPLCQKIQSMKNIKLIGVACHIGSQLTELSPFVEAIDRVLELVRVLAEKNILLQHINIGGGLGVRYQNEQPPSIEEYVKTLCQHLAPSSLSIILEPGRAISARAGVLLTRVEYLKHNVHKNFAIVDAAMNDFMRPSLYNAWQQITTVIEHPSGEEKNYDIVGPICESGDFLGKNRLLRLQAGELLAIREAGAYGFSMSSNYNSRPRVAEVMVDKDKTYLIRRRETIAELFMHEKLIP